MKCESKIGLYCVLRLARTARTWGSFNLTRIRAWLDNNLCQQSRKLEKSNLNKRKHTDYLRPVYLLLILVIFCLSIPISGVKAESLKRSLEVLAKSHKTMIASDADVSGAKEGVATAKGDWYPTFDVTANIANDQKNVAGNASPDNKNLVARNLEMSVTQKVWDFGSTNSAIRSAKLTLQQAMATRESTLQNLLLQGITAHYNIVRAQKLFDFAEASAANIRKQSELEDARVQRGSGLSTDVLQAKTQLAGAEARVIQARGSLKTALNRYKAIFGYLPADISALDEPRLPLTSVPISLDDAINKVLRNNPDLIVSRIGTEIAQETVRKTKVDEFLPTFEGSIANNYSEDNGGTFGSSSEQIIKLEGTFSLNMGLTAINTLKASRLSQLANVNRYRDLKDTTEEKTRNAWDNLQTARDNAAQLHNQANIAAEFLELARRERKLGNRSLIDVLGGETALINASSDATSADTTLAIAIYTLLSIMGEVDPNIFEN